MNTQQNNNSNNNLYMSVELLIEIVKAYNKYIMQNNKYNENDLIKISNEINANKLKMHYINELNGKFKQCNLNQKCLIEQPFMDYIDKEKYDNLKNKTNISNAFKQYIKKYTTFKYLGL
jgi:hypothetical protein